LKPISDKHLDDFSIGNATQQNARRLNIAYLTTKYPSVSHTFIRRELCEIERRRHKVLRLAIRKSDGVLVDPKDQEEAAKTIHCLNLPLFKHATSFLRIALSKPLDLFDALRVAIGMGARSDRGILKHLAYLVEACSLYRVLQEHGIQHVHVHFGTNSTAVARLIYRLGVSYSFTVHGPTEFDSANAFDLQGKISDALFVVAITDFCYAQLCRWSSPKDWQKIHVVGCTVGEDFFNSLEYKPLSSSSKQFVCIGRLTPQKGQLVLLEAFVNLVAKGYDARLAFVGDGELRDIIEQKISETGIEEKVQITGFVSEKQVREYIAKSRALVLPSFAEGLPMVIMEAFAMGRPVISTFVAGIPELVKDGENGWLVPAGNISKLMEAMIDVLKTPVSRLEEMAANGCKLTYENHNTNTETARLEQIFMKYIKPITDE